MQNFSIQALSDALTSLESKVTVVQPPSKEYALLLEVTIADRPGHPHPPMFSWNASMVLHILKGDPTLRDLEHIQVDGPGTAYLFFYEQGHQGLKQDAAETLQAHVAEAFSEWISCSAHFVIILLLLVEVWWRAMAASDRHRQRSRVKYPNHPVLCMVSSESNSMPSLVGSAPTSTAWMGQIEEGGGHAPRVPTSWLRGRPPKTHPAKDCTENSLPSSPNRVDADLDGYIMMSEAQSTHYHRRK